MGPPLATFESIVPKGNSIFSYYGVANPKTKTEKQLLELNSNDPLMSHFKFVELTKLLPYTDAACKPDGICLDSLQI